MIKPRRSKKYFAPQREDGTHDCDYEGCLNKGEYKAPKDRILKEYYWFCLEHVQKYNATWNYYDGISADSPEEEFDNPNFRRFKSKIHFSLFDDFDFFDSYRGDFQVFLTKEEQKFFNIMELNVQTEINLKVIKKQYKKLAIKYHPDVNNGDKEMEEKFKDLTVAYEYLLNKFS